ncbi:hypothetical protein TNIN_340811 [Trichonephila inaurata madagascariensis]|uniref:Uncharacterized protein n=1 Tax=Trichonephila inaurata madagascariensis TaxID=2747483 RepID=A0A8X6Y050_9ARAC|nr:hypothetical protein TNIN_340811 [Trichonephila inaurata madagascariensis]
MVNREALSCHSLRIRVVFKGSSSTIIKIFTEKIEHYSLSVWPSTVFNELQVVGAILQSSLNVHKLINNSQVLCCSNRLVSEKGLNKSSGWCARGYATRTFLGGGMQGRRNG